MHEVLVALETVPNVFARTSLAQLGLIFASIQIVGYAIYMKSAKDPHPLTWLMLAYGTFAWTLLAWANGTEASVLFLPAACALCSIVILAMVMRRGKWRWPQGFVEWFSLGGDILLTLAYAGAGIALWQGAISEDQRELANLVFLWGANLTTFTSMAPLVTEARKNPESERSNAWMLWFIAYTGMSYVAYQEEGLKLEVLFYPVLNTMIHGLVAYYVTPQKRQIA